jgi:hypothetical protein
MPRDNDTIWCDGCGVEILWVPVRVKHVTIAVRTAETASPANAVSGRS